MKIVTYTATYSRNFRLANYGGPEYENIKAEATITVELEPDEHEADIIAAVNALAKDAVQQQVKPVLDHYRKRTEDVRSHLPSDVQESLED